MVNSYLADNWQVVATVRQEEESGEEAEIDTNLLVSTWNRRSPLAAKNVLLNGLNRFEGIDEAIIIFPPDGENRPLHETPAAAIEAAIDGQVKSQLFMIKEVLNYFQRENRGRLYLLRQNQGSDTPPPLDAVSTGSFHALSRSLFSFYQNEEVSINAFETDSADCKAFISFIKKTLEEKGRECHGKVFRYSEKGVLGNLGKGFRR